MEKFGKINFTFSGDLPGVETSYPAEHGTTPMPEKEMATTAENEVANDVQEQQTEAGKIFF